MRWAFPDRIRAPGKLMPDWGGRRGHPGSGGPHNAENAHPHASAAMTQDAYADLFESDLDEVAVTVAKMWPREPETNARSAPKTL